MSFFSPNFNWTSGFGTFTFSSDLSGCKSIGLSSTYPPANASDSQGLIPRAIIPGASVVANITKVQDFNGNVSISTCDDSSASLSSRDARGWTPQVGKLTVIEGQCVMITVRVDTTNCSKNTLEIESALIGDFCAQSPNADVCKNYDAKVTVPPVLRETQGGDMPIVTSNATAAPSTGSKSSNSSGAEAKSGAVPTSTHRVVLASLAACVVAMASLS